MKPKTNPRNFISAEDTANDEGRVGAEISAILKRLVHLLDGRWIELCHCSDDFNAITWIRQSVEDLEATIVGLTQSDATYWRGEGHLHKGDSTAAASPPGKPTPRSSPVGAFSTQDPCNRVPAQIQQPLTGPQTARSSATVGLALSVSHPRENQL